MMVKERYHNDPGITRLGTEAPRSYYVPYSTPDEALENSREKSGRFKLLSGCKWAFSYYDSFENIPDNITDASNGTGFLYHLTGSFTDMTRRSILTYATHFRSICRVCQRPPLPAFIRPILSLKMIWMFSINTLYLKV